MKRAILFTLIVIGMATLVGMATLGQAEPLPECGYTDIPTKFQDYSDWQRTLLDTAFKLPESYYPEDLVSVRKAGIEQDYQVRAIILEHLAALMQAAAAAGHPLAIQSAFRSYDYQERTFAYWVEQDGREAALKSSARPGHSEHQLGTVVDFRSADGPPAWELEDWAQTPAGAWLKKNAHRYGFVMSYPKGKSNITCYIYEPWHYRYLGRELAGEVFASGLTLREWLWERWQS